MTVKYIPLLLAALLLATTTAAHAQNEPWGPLTVLSRTDIESTTELALLGLSDHNKPNGRIYRLRQSIPGDLTQSQVNP